MGFCLHVYLYTTYMHGLQRAEEGFRFPPRLELQTVVCWHVGAGHWTWVLWKSWQSSYPPSHFSGPRSTLKTKKQMKRNYFIYFFFVCVYVEVKRRTSKRQFSLDTMWGLEIELGLSGLVVGGLYPLSCITRPEDYSWYERWSWS